MLAPGSSSTSQRILTELRRALTAADPVEALAGLTALRAELERFERQQVRRALEDGATFTAIARGLGISRQAAHRRYRGLLADQGVTLTPAVHRALMLAREEAARTGARTVEPEHVALALTRGRGPAPTCPLPSRMGYRLSGLLRDLESPVELEELRRALRAQDLLDA